MAKINHGVSIDIDDQEKLYISKDEEEVKTINNNDSLDKKSFNKSFKKNLVYRLLKHFRNLLYQLKYFFIIVIYSILGALIFIYIEKDYDLTSKQESYNYHLVARDMLFHSLKQIHIENKNDRENRWKEAILEFETNINALPPSLETSWTFSMAIFYAGTIYTTIGYGNIACATTTGRIVSIIYAFIGIPIFLIILNNLNEFLLKKIKMISIIFEDNLFYYSIKFGLLKLKGEKRMKYYKKLEKEKNFENFLDNELIEFSKITENNDTYIRMDIEENEKSITHDPPILTGVFVTLIWIFLSAGLFCLWEDWTYGSSTYFIFISLLTIGFGDIYPIKKPELFCWAFGAVIVGLSLVTVCISLCQEKVELLYKAILDKLLEDYIKALESGDPNAVKDAMSEFGGKAKFIMPLISKSKGLKMMEQLKNDAKEKGIDLPPSISSVNPETGRPNFCDTNKNKLDDLIKNETLNIEKRSLMSKNKFEEEKTKKIVENVKTSQIQTDESLLDEYIKNSRKLNNCNITDQISSIIDDNIVQTENKRIINSDEISNVKVLTTNTSNQTDITLLQDCGIQPDVSYIFKQFHIKNNDLNNIRNNEKLKCKNIVSSDENIFVNFMKDTSSDPIDVLIYKNTSIQTQDITMKSRRSQTRFTGIVKARKNIKDHHKLKEYDHQKNKHQNKKVNKDGITKKEKRHLKNFLLKIRENDGDKKQAIDNINDHIDKQNLSTTKEEMILLMKELEDYRLKNNIYKFNDDLNSYDYELKSETQQVNISNNISINSQNQINKKEEIHKELNLNSEPSSLTKNNLLKRSESHFTRQNPLVTSQNTLQKVIKNKNSSTLSDNLEESFKLDNKFSSSLQNISFHEKLNGDNLKLKVSETIYDFNNDEKTNVALNDNVSCKNFNNIDEIFQLPQKITDECIMKKVPSDSEKYEEVTINIELIKKLKNEEFKLITNREKEYILKLTENKNLLFSDSSDSEEYIDDVKIDQFKSLHDRFSSEDDNLSIEELFTDKWVQTENEFEFKKATSLLQDNADQYDKKIEKMTLIDNISQTNNKDIKHNDTQTIINENCSVQCQTMIEIKDISTQEPYRDPEIFDGIYIKNIAIQASCDYGNFSSQYNYETPKIDSQTQYACNKNDFESQYIYKPNTTSTESQVKAECADFNDQYTFIPLTINSEVQVSYKKKENNTQTEIKFFEDQAVQFTVEKINEETQVGFDDGIISRNTSLKNLIIREIECTKESAENISKLCIKKNIKEDIASSTKFTLFEDDSKLTLKSKKWKSDFLTKEEKNKISSSHNNHQINISNKDMDKKLLESTIKVQHYNKKLEFTNFGNDFVNKSSSNDLCTQKGIFESTIDNIKTEKKNEKNTEDVVDVGIQTGVLARVQHIYGEDQKILGASDSGNTVPPEFQKVSLKKIHAIDDKGVYRSVDVTPPTSPSSITIRKNPSLKRDRSSKLYSDNLRNLTKESTVPDLIRSFSTYEEQEDSSLSGKLDSSKKK